MSGRRNWIPAFVGMTMVLSGAAAADNSKTEALIEACELEPARKLVEQTLKDQPADADALSALGYLKLLDGDSAGAVEALEKSVILEPKSAQAQMRLGQTLAAHVNNVGMFSKMGIAKRMRDAFIRAVELKPESIFNRTGLLQFYAQAPGIAGGDMDKAREQAAAIAALDPVEGIYARGFIAFGDGEKKDAEKLFEEAAAKGHAQASHTLAGYFYVEAKRWDDAFSMIETLLKKEPGNLPALNSFGRIAAKSGQRLERGEAALKEFLKNPRSACAQGGNVTLAYVHLNLGTIYQKIQRTGEALKEYQAALKLYPDLKQAKESLDELEDEPAAESSSRPR